MAENDSQPESAGSPKLPLNARRPKPAPVAIASQQRPQQSYGYSHSIGYPTAADRPSSSRGAAISSSLARATSLLSQPGDYARLSTSPAAQSYLARQKQLERAVDHPTTSGGGNGSGNDSDAASRSSRKKQPLWAMERAEVARRVKNHLVTRPASSLMSPTAAPDDGGYAADTNDDFYEDDSHAARAHTPAGPHSASPRQLRPRDAEEEEVADPFQLQSGDITYQIYRWQGKHLASAHPVADSPTSASASVLLAPDSASPLDRKRPRDSAAAHAPRRRSFSGWDSDSEWNLPYRSGELNVPGGFRRQFVRERAERQGRAAPGFLAETFVDFIALYGHFAGGYYMSDEDEEYFDYMQGCGGDEDEGAQPTERSVGAASTVVADERTPLRRVQSGLHASSSDRKAFLLIIKAFIGTGVLVLPRAFYNGGLLTSCVLMIAVAWYAWHCILLLAEVYLHIGGGSYSDIGRRLFGRWMQYAVTSSIVLAQIGGCCAYTIFVAQNWRNVFNTLSGCRLQLSMQFWVLVQLLVFIPLALIRQIRYFAPVALLANALIIASLSYLLGFDLWSIFSNGPAPIVNYNPARFPLLVGTAVYSFEGITLVIPILDSLKEKRKFPRVLTLAITLCLGLFLCVGSLSYSTFGESVEAVVLLNLPNESSWTILVQLLYSIAILFSMPLQLFPAVKIMEAMMFTRSGREHKAVKWQKNMFRTAMAVFIAMIAIFGADQLDNVVSLVGSFCLVPLSFIYPSSMHLRLMAHTPWVRFKDSVLIVVGVVAMVYVTYISVSTWGASDPPLDICASVP
ncbi:hypothetical protein LPJ75_001688 [Coemansia sp. RSA 2598]|nr:hypothetical protein LPJ75_001688 [Coemansia sp. RSA 2598]